jgi:hypothetical protein
LGVACFALSFSAYAGGVVVFSAPSPEMRASAKAALEAANYTALDGSDIDHALFDGKPKLTAPGIPAEVRDEFQKGEATCKARKQAALLPDCLRGLSQVVWQRWLERVGAQRVVEFRAPESEGGKLVSACATYQPKDAFISGGAVAGKTAAELGAKVVKIIDGASKLTRGVRPNSNLLPGAEPLRLPDLDDGVEQDLSPLASPCKARPIRVGPSNAPLAKTISLLYRASNPQPVGPEQRCTLSFSEAAGRFPSAVVLSCDSSVATYPLYASQNFASPDFQADVARELTSMALAQQCQP